MTVVGAHASDRALLRRAALTSALLTAASVTVVVMIVGLLAYLLAGRELSNRDHDLVRQAATSADDVSDPPAGVILFSAGPDGPQLHSRDTPAGLAHTRIGHRNAGFLTMRTDEHSYLGYVSVRRSGERFLALLRPEQMVDPSRLLVPVLLAGAAGVVAAAIVGGLLGRRSTRPLGHALALQRNFVADASHELRAPLTLLHTRAQLLERSLRASSDRALADEAADLVADTRTLDEVVHDLLLSAELEHQPERSEAVDMGRLAGQVAAAFGVRADQLQVQLTATVGAGAMTVPGAGTALRRAISSLVDNALAHTPAGGHVAITVSEADDHIVVAVADDGEGLDPAQTRALLQRFARGRGRSGQGRRFGLGLALVDQIIRAHQGSLVIDGRPGAGAVFTVRLPVLG